jgi:ribosome recycling factor
MIANNVITKFNNAITHLEEELKRVRTGRAHPDMLMSVQIDAYGSKMPINQVANITNPESNLLQITPFDPNSIQSIAEAIRSDQSLGLNPSDDGRVIRIVVPSLTEERRKEIAKQLGEYAENTRIQLRQTRQEHFSHLKKEKSEGIISEDELKRLEKEVDEKMSELGKTIDNHIKAKEAEIMSL